MSFYGPRMIIIKTQLVLGNFKTVESDRMEMGFVDTKWEEENENTFVMDLKIQTCISVNNNSIHTKIEFESVKP